MTPSPLLLGWREWVALPDLGLLAVEAKVDTGADTSVLHAVGIERLERDGQPWVQFTVHPLADDENLAVTCAAPVVGMRSIRSSNGATEARVVIRTTLRLGLRIDARAWPIDLTLTDRRAMRLRMLLGRSALAGHAHIDPATPHHLGTPSDAGAFYPR